MPNAEPGDTIALVGPTGAGKTSIANLVARFYEVNDGAVLIDGQDVRDITMQSLHEQMGLVPQEPDYADFPLWPDAHFCPEIPPEVFDQEIQTISRWVFAQNRSLRALTRRGRAILRSGPGVFLKKGLAYGLRRAGFLGRRPGTGGHGG